MPVSYRTRNQLLLAVIESPSGTEGSPTPAANAVRVRLPLTFSPQREVLETNYVQGGIDESLPLIGGGFNRVQTGTILQGAGTAGQAPDIGPLLRACGFEQVLTATAVTGTAQAGAASSITLAASASSTDDAYKGMVIRITGGTGNGQRRVITAYNGTTKVATIFPQWTTTPNSTSAYSIDANALYRLRSANMETVTLWGYFLNSAASGQAIRRRLIGAAGNLRISMNPRGFPEVSFDFQGLEPANPDLVAAPATPTYQAEASQPILSADAYFGTTATTEANARLQFSEFTFDLGNELNNFDDPRAANGYDITEITRRLPGGTLTFNILKTPRDVYADFTAGNDRVVWLNWGATAGKRVSILLPQIRAQNYEEGDVRGYTVETIPYRCGGVNDAVWLCLW